MKPGKIILIGVGVVAAIGIVYFIAKKLSTPAFTVYSFDSASGTASFTFGAMSASTNGSGGGDAGNGWGANWQGNNITITKDGQKYSAFTITQVGPVTI